MPAARFWEFEDAQVYFGAIDAGPTDILRLLLVEFALSYGNDWFVIPVELDVSVNTPVTPGTCAKSREFGAISNNVKSLTRIDFCCTSRFLLHL